MGYLLGNRLRNRGYFGWVWGMSNYFFTRQFSQLDHKLLLWEIYLIFWNFWLLIDKGRAPIFRFWGSGFCRAYDPIGYSQLSITIDWRWRTWLKAFQKTSGAYEPIYQSWKGKTFWSPYRYSSTFWRLIFTWKFLFFHVWKFSEDVINGRLLQVVAQQALIIRHHIFEGVWPSRAHDITKSGLFSLTFD